MRIIHCPKGGRIPEGYCQDSCLNYPGCIDRESFTHMLQSRHLSDHGERVDTPFREDEKVYMAV